MPARSVKMVGRTRAVGGDRSVMEKRIPLLGYFRRSMTGLSLERYLWTMVMGRDSEESKEI